MVAKGFSRMDERFEGVDGKLKGVDKKFEEVFKLLDDIDYRLGKIESNHERRLDILEDRMAVTKTYFEKNLKVKF